MKFKYAGHKTVISQYGISFKQGKDDKFVFYPYVYEILNALDNDYDLHKKHSYQIKKEELNIEKLLDMVFKYNPDLLLDMDNKVNSYIKNLDDEETRIKQRTTLTSIEKDVYLANLESMREYKIQRAKNKIFYFFCIESIVQIITNNKIKMLELPFNGLFLHVLKSVQNKLSTHKISSSLNIEDEKDILKIKFSINLY